MAHRVLVVTNEDLADANEVPQSIRPLVDEAEEIYVVAPALTTWMQWLTDESDRAVVSADERLRTVFAHMHAGGLRPHGEVGAENQLTAIADALAEFDADLIVLRLHAPGTEHENWREHRIAEKVRSHFDVPTTVFYFDPEGHVVQRENA
jgi:hypothetical protein